MRLVYIIGTYPLVTTTFIEREVRTLRAMGASVRLVSIRRPHGGNAQSENGILYLLPPDWVRLLWAHLFFALTQTRVYGTLLVWMLTRPHRDSVERVKTFLHFGEGVYAAYLLRAEPFDHIHAHFVDRAALVALCIGKLLNKAYSLTAHANDIFIAPALLAEKLGGARFVVTVSEFNKEYLLRHCPGLKAERVRVLHPWVELKDFQPSIGRTPTEQLTILSVGRLVEKKGHRYLIEACSLLHKRGMELDCHILGEGPLGEELEELIRANDLTGCVHLDGAQPQEQVLAHLKRADVFVLPVVIAPNGDRDGMPVALAEAMAMQLPVISTNILGIPEMVRPSAGILVPPEDSATLAEAIAWVSKMSPEERLEMGRHARQVVAENFELVNGVQQLAALFDASIHRQDERALQLMDTYTAILEDTAHSLP